MPNPVKYSTTTPSGSLRKGNMAIGVNPNVAFGPTSTTGFYAGITPPSGGYTIYQNKLSQGPSIYVVNNDAQLITRTNTQVAGTVGSPAGYTTVAQCLNYYATQTDKIIVNKNYPGIVTSGSVLNLDAGFLPSYPTTSSTWYDTSGNTNNSTLTNGSIYNSLGVISFDNVDDYVQISSSLDLNTLAATRNMTICFTAKKLFYGTGGNNTGDSMVLIGANNGYNSGFRITETNLGTPGTAFTGTPAYGFGAPPIANGIGVTSPRTGQNTFSYVAFSQSGSSMLGFINGRFTTVTFTNAYTPGANNGAIGRDVGFGVGWFGGYLGNFQIYNRALTQAEILQNYYQAPIVTDGLVFAVDAGNIVSYENGSTTTYSLTGSLSGSLTNGTSYNSENGGAWSFDGTDDSISVLDDAVLDFTGSVNLTSEMWINFNLYKDISIVNAKGDGGGQTTAYNYLFLGSNSSFYFRISDGITSQNSPFIGKSNLPEGTWGHVVGVLDTTAIRLYLNGVEIGTATTRTINPKSNNNPFYISTSTYSLNGKIGISRIYNRALTAAEVAQNFNAQKSRFGL